MVSWFSNRLRLRLGYSVFVNGEAIDNVDMKEIPDFRAGDTVRVDYKIKEGDKERVQPFEGIVIARKGAGEGKTFTVRKIASGGIGVERIFPLGSPWIEGLEVVKKGKPRRAKLYYLRGRKGKAAMKV